MNRHTLYKSVFLRGKEGGPYQFTPLFANSFLLVLSVLFGIGFFYYIRQCVAPLEGHLEINLSPYLLPKYTFFSLCRGGVAYILSLCFSVIIGYIAAKDRLAEKILIPCLDILQSIPVLGFMPGLFLLFVFLFPLSNMGLELTSIVMIFTGQTWNMAFCVYHAMRTIPTEKKECATFYRLSNWQCFKSVELPSSTIALVWNSIMGVAGGWFFLMTSEAFRLHDRDFRLPGLGSYMSAAAARGDIPSMILAIVFMVLLIVFLDQLFWRPLVVWAQKFRSENTSASFYPRSWFLDLLKKTFLARLRLPRFSFFIKKKGDQRIRILPFAIRCFICIVSIAALLGIITLAQKLITVPLTVWMHLGKMTLITFSRVLICLIISIVVALPLGLIIGLSKKASATLQPILQVGASFPATLLFPALIWLFHQLHIPLNIGTIVLMLMGTGWYVLFTTLAGIEAIPNEYKEVAKLFTLKPWQKLFSFYIPAIAPYVITGAISAAGGAWNASIVSEYITYKNQVFTVPGIGSSISLAAGGNDITLLLASICCLALFVALINYFFWLRLYHYSEKHFSLNG